jgi:Na+-translocating ferredoxin:NAD+ oxidoreductase RnfG subunit
MDFELTGIITGSIAILSLFVGLPAIILSFVYKNTKNKREKEIEKLKYQKEVLELEMEKENIHIKLLEEENKKLDKIINGN